MLYKLFLEKKKKDALEKKKNNLACIFTISITILMGIFGIFISHYNGGNFIDETKADNAMVTSTKVDNKVVPEVNNKATAYIITDDISSVTISTNTLIIKVDLNSVSATDTLINFQIDTTIKNIFKSTNLDLFQTDYSIDRARQSASTQK